MFDMISKTAMMVSDFKAYPDQFPMRDPTCLVSASFTHKDVQAMHTEDAVDDADLAAPPAPPLTRSRTHSLQAPLPADPSVPPVTSAPATPPLPPASIFDQPFSSMTESELATAFLNNNVAFVLPSQYRPPNFPPPEAEMIVIGTRVQRLSKLKSSLWVRFLSPPSYKDKKLQLYPRSLELHKGPGQGQDFSLLSTFEILASPSGHAQPLRQLYCILYRFLPGFRPPYWATRNGTMMYSLVSAYCRKTLLLLRFHVCHTVLHYV